MPPHAPPKNGSASSGAVSFEATNEPDARRSLRLIHALIDQARRWTDHALRNSRLDPVYVVEKALAALAFTLRFFGRDGTPAYDESAPYHDEPTGSASAPGSQGSVQDALHGTIVLSIPTKLVGVAAVQPNVRALRSRATAGARFSVRTTEHDLVVFWQGLAIGRIQDKHAGWLAPLLPASASVHLIAVTGDETRGHTLGVNVFVRVEATL